jgi:hypothetical protein
MATITVFTCEQIAERETKPAGGVRPGRRRSPERTQIIEAFKGVLEQAEPGYGADVTLSEGEDKRIVRQNLKAAAEELGQVLDFRPIKDKSRIHFRVITPEEKAAKPRRSGRPRKVQPEAAAEPAQEQGAEQQTRPRRSRKGQASPE